MSRRLILVMCLLSTIPLTCAYSHEIGIQREYSSQNCVSGYLLVDAKVICYVLERPWQNNTPLISSIPAGSYAAFIREDAPKGWRLELVSVPGKRKHVQIHIGNTIADSTGCLLPGTVIADNLCEVYKSAEAMSLLKSALTEFSPFGSDNEITVTISDGGGLDSNRFL